MFSKVYNGKKIILILFTIMFAINLFPETKNAFYAIVTHLETKNNTSPTLNYDEISVPIKLNDKIKPGATILTAEGQLLEIIIYQNNVAYGIILIKENTDFRFQLNNLTTMLDIRVIYGGVRAVIGEEVLSSINSQTIKTAVYGADIGLVSVADSIGMRKGYSIVFGGELAMASRQNLKNTETVKALQVCDFFNYTIYTPKDFIKYDLVSWKKDMLFRTKDIPNNLMLILETLDPETLFKEEEEKKPRFDPRQVLSSILSFEAGTTQYDRSIAIKSVWRPGISSVGNKFEIGFYFPFNFIPSKAFTPQYYMPINGGNNEWSFGSDQAGNGPALVFDLFDDLLLKMRIIRYNTPEEHVFLQFGEYYNISDLLDFSMVNFSSRIFYPKYRNFSFFLQLQTSFFKGVFYAENLMPKGIYGTDLMLMTPSKTFRFTFRVSAFIDCYDLIKFEDTESFFPAQFNTTLKFDAFNVPSLGLSVFLSGGMLMPFSNNFYTNTSLYNDLLTYNPTATAAGLSANAGILFRILDFNLYMEFILDSGLNKVGLFDTLYLAKREQRSQLISSWLNNMQTDTLSLSSFNFGSRIRIKYNFFKYVSLETSYQFTLASGTLMPFYYDKIYFKLAIDSVDKWKVNFGFFINWQLEDLAEIAQSSTPTKDFQENNVAFFGFNLKPHVGVDLNLSVGLFPDFIYYSDPWYSQFMFDFYIVLKPLPLYTVHKKKQDKINL